MVESNIADKYYPGDFDSMTREKSSEDLLPIVTRLIVEPSVLQKVEKSMRMYRTMLTIEDMVAYYGKSWRFDDNVIEVGKTTS